ncbi:uncharacterized protein LOC143294228 [Babylonia areolata]|uniref:uncharacterized protein LOC143294228 n=1 Tax=Babylonia areolata TaxID=304850 RepID=UPI003FD2EB9A
MSLTYMEWSHYWNRSNDRLPRFITRDYKSRNPGCVTKMLEDLNLAPLEERRRQQRLNLLHKTAEERIPALPPGEVLKPVNTGRRRIHPTRYTGFSSSNIIERQVVNNPRGFSQPSGPGLASPVNAGPTDTDPPSDTKVVVIFESDEGTTTLPVMRTPIPENPFDKVGVDIVGPIRPASSRGNRYVLVQVDHTTRYPDAVPLKNIDTVTVAEVLWGLWCRTGVPKTVLTDKGTQFTSNMMGEVHRLLGIKGETTTPYHAQCNGVMERFNGTLKKMIRKLAMDRPTEWNQWIPAALFAYRETPQESTGFTRFELLYGRQVRGPLFILKEGWTEPGEEEENRTVAEYVVDLRNRIVQTCEIARQAVKKAAGTNKRYFDRKARQRTFDPDDRVYVLRPAKHNKLELTWQGPYRVIERLGEVDYKIQMPQGTTVWHANMLKKHVPREESRQVEPAVQAIVLEPDPEGEECSVRSDDIPLIPLEATEGVEDVVIETEDPDFAEQLRVLVEEFDDVFTDLPTCTTLEECRINLRTDVPVCCKPYPVPFSQRETVEKEIDAMLKLGVIEPSTSSYASPIVLVKKKDGKVRFYVDYRKLNKVVEFDTEPIPDIDCLFAKLGDKVVLSKIDLARGYWQILVAEEDRPITAFVTHQGCYQWRVMPFGLCTSGAVFTCMMRRLILPPQTPDIDNFIDDVLVATETKEEHLQTLRKLFLRLRECHVLARPSKCELGCQEVEYLGHRVGDGKIQPTLEKMQKIREAPRPVTKKEVRSFLGLVGYYRKFIPRFANIALPLTNLTKGGEPRKVRWTDECQEAFDALKDKLCSAPVCRLPVANKPFVLQTDASETGVGAILLQVHDGEMHPAACASKKLLPAEKKYPIIEKECLALVWGVNKFARYLDCEVRGVSQFPFVFVVLGKRGQRASEDVGYVNLCFQRVAADILRIKLTRPELEQQHRVVKAEVIHHKNDRAPVTRPAAKGTKSSLCSIQ